MYNRIFIFALCALCLVGCTKTNETKATSLFSGSKDDIFIDEDNADVPQADAPDEGSAVAAEFSDDEDSSGVGPDDEDGFEGSGEGSGRPAGGFAGPREKNEDTPVTPSVSETPTRPYSQPKSPEAEEPEEPRILLPVPTTTTPAPKSHDTGLNAVPEPPLTRPTTERPNLRNDYPPVDDNNEGTNEVLGRKSEERPTSFFSQPGILAAVIGGAVVGLLCAILLVMFIVYRMRKKDEGSYALDEPKRSPRNTSAYQPPNKEFYA